MPETRGRSTLEADPVCGRTIADDEARRVDQGTSRRATKVEHQGRWLYFCGLMCRTEFVSGPAAYVQTTLGR